MPTPFITGIFIAPEKSVPMISHESIEAVTSKGLVGDRYYLGKGYYSGQPGWGAQVTLFQQEAIDAVNVGHQTDIQPELLRRNLMTRHIDVLTLIKRTFRCGTAILRGTKRFPPCKHLIDLCGRKEVLKYFAYASGIGAEVIENGVIKIGDELEIID